MSDLLHGMAALVGSPGSVPSPVRHHGATSDLSVDEVLLLHSIGWEPVDLSFGVSWWSVPWSAWQWQTGEVVEGSAAFSSALAEASRQLEDDCARVGAAGVVGVRVDLAIHTHHIEVALSGTAVRQGSDAHRGATFLSDLSARDFVLLARAGWQPVGLAGGASFVIAPRRTAARQWAAQQSQNVELPHLTTALYLARERAMEGMQRKGLEMHADGIVGVKLREGPLGHNSRIIQFVAIGTGVQMVSAEHRPLRPSMVVPLNETVRMFQATKLRSTPPQP